MSTRRPAGAVHHRRVEQRVHHLLRVVVHLLADRNHARLDRRQPGRERAGIMLDQERGEALMRAQRRAVDDIDRMLRAVLADIFEVEGLGGEEIELVGGDGVFGADGRA